MYLLRIVAVELLDEGDEGELLIFDLLKMAHTTLDATDLLDDLSVLLEGQHYIIQSDKERQKD
jgi:ethanolamine utilization protein EutQ (cupin superfamily)